MMGVESTTIVPESTQTTTTKRSAVIFGERDFRGTPFVIFGEQSEWFSGNTFCDFRGTVIFEEQSVIFEEQIVIFEEQSVIFGEQEKSYF